MNKGFGLTAPVVVACGMFVIATSATTALADTPTATNTGGKAAADPLDFTHFDIYASDGYVLTHQYTTDAGDSITTIDTRRPGVTREIQAEGSVTTYETLSRARGQITLEQVSRFDAAGDCQSSYKTRYQWLAVFPDVANK